MTAAKNIKGPAFGVRHVQYIFLFFIKTLVYSMRYNLSVAIIAMTQNTSSNPDIPYYNWTNKNIILSSFFWGYIIPQIAAGDLGRIFGTKKLLIINMIINSTMMLLIPVVASLFGSIGVIACRVLQGISQGFVYPLSSSLLGKWVPVEERARVGAFLFSGSTLGLILTYSVTGFLSKSSFGWPMSFYLFGTLGVLWIILYYFLGSDDTASHKTITKEEKSYIELSLETSQKLNTKTPWKAILTSVPLWAIILTSLGHGWGTSIFYSEVPSYFDKILKFDISSNGVLSSLPYLVSFSVTPVVGFCSDYLINNKYLSITNARKVFTFIGSCGTGTLILVFGYLPESTNRYLAVCILVMGISIHAMVSTGYVINHLDLSPNFSGTLMGLINTAEELFSIITPLATQFIVTDENNRNQWQIIFGIGAAMFFTSALIFGKCATAKKQWWNEVTDYKTTDKTVLDNRA